MRHFIILIIIFLSTSSCNHEPAIILKSVRVDSTKPKYSNDILVALPKTTQDLGLSQINKGITNFEFRFWLPGSNLDTINILSIKNESNKWRSSLTKFLATIPDHEFIRGDTTNYFMLSTIKYVTTSKITPDIDINSIVDSLAIFDLQNSPSNAEIEEGQVSSSGDVRYILEFADSANYRVIHYLRARRNTEPTEFDNSFERFLSFIKRHFKINTP